MGHRCLHIFSSFRGVCPHTSSKYCCQPGFLVTNFSIMFLPSPWPSSQTAGFNWYKSTRWSLIGIKAHIWSFLQCSVNTQVHYSKLCSLEIALHHCSSGMFQKGDAVLQLSTPVAPALSCRTIGKPGLSLLILCHLITGNSP